MSVRSHRVVNGRVGKAFALCITASFASFGCSAQKRERVPESVTTQTKSGAEQASTRSEPALPGDTEQWRGPSVIDVYGLDEPLARTKPTTQLEDEAINDAIDAFDAFDPQATALLDGDEFLAPLEAFVSLHPSSGWTPTVQTNLGIAYYRLGYFSRAFDAWNDAWQQGRDATQLEAKAIIDRAVGELARMHSRVGHADELRELFRDMGSRRVTGSATELIANAHEAEWHMRKNPGDSFLCGPQALRNVLSAVGASPDATAYIDWQVRSGPRGFTLDEVARVADQSGLPHRLIHRLPGQDIPVPSVVNWKVDHYAAIVGFKNGYYYIKDPTFGNSAVVSLVRSTARGLAERQLLAPRTAMNTPEIHQNARRSETRAGRKLHSQAPQQGV